MWMSRYTDYCTHKKMAPGKVFLLLLYTFHVCGVSSVVHNGKTTINETFEQLAGAGGSSSSSSSSGGGLDAHSNPNHHSVATLKQTRWAEAAYGYVHTLNCAEAFITTERECRNLVRLKRSAMNIYLADPTAYGRYGAVLPDGGLSKAGLHDGVLVVDPYPQANFGHIVIVFFLDLGTTRTVCTRDGGSYLGSGECITLALKRRCKNALERRSRRRNFARRCEVNFLPFVFRENLPSDQRKQELSCRDNIPGYAKCPALRPTNETTGLICNPIRDNTKRCETTHQTIHTSCRVFEICDQAVIISGGWNRQASLPRHKNNVANFYHMLRRHGFLKRNIKVFFANGAKGIRVDGEGSHDVHPSAMKMAFRFHIQRLCGSPHCVDSLLLYLNSPSRSDGSSLLWDVDGDGIAEDSERYKMEELLEDTENCAARQVQLVVDQSYAGEIARSIRRSKRHQNVVVFGSSRDNEYSYASDYTDHWVTFNHTHTCARQVHRESRAKIRHSTPEMQEGEDGVINTTIFGAPCDVVPPFTEKELRQNYLGCQNLPTALWIINFLSATEKNNVDPTLLPTTLRQRLTHYQRDKEST